jgi:hypothetical protein
LRSLQACNANDKLLLIKSVIDKHAHHHHELRDAFQARRMLR